MALGSIQPLNGINTRNISLGVKTARRRAEFSTFLCRLSWNQWASNSWNSHVLSRPVHRLFCLSFVSLRRAVNYSPIFTFSAGLDYKHSVKREITVFLKVFPKIVLDKHSTVPSPPPSSASLTSPPTHLQRYYDPQIPAVRPKTRKGIGTCGILLATERSHWYVRMTLEG